EFSRPAPRKVCGRGQYRRGQRHARRHAAASAQLLSGGGITQTSRGGAIASPGSLFFDHVDDRLLRRSFLDGLLPTDRERGRILRRLELGGEFQIANKSTSEPPARRANWGRPMSGCEP